MTIKLIDAKVVSRDDQGAGIAVIEIESCSGEALPKFDAGAHIDVHINDDLIRQYSLSNSPINPSNYRLGVLKDPNSRGGSVELHRTFEPGKEIKISEPRNHFPLDTTAKKTILAGGGIGITPMITMAYTLKAKGLPFELHYCTRSAGAGAFEDELKAQFPDEVVFHYDDAGEDQLFSPEKVFLPYDKGLHIYVCGPTGFMDWVINSAKGLDYPSAQVHFEYFSAEVDLTGSAFEVYCSASDLTVEVTEDMTIAKALKAAGVKVDVSCEEGVCGTCITDVLEGEPDHRDHFLTDEEKDDNDQMALCCSRSKSSRLVIDI